MSVLKSIFGSSLIAILGIAGGFLVGGQNTASACTEGICTWDAAYEEYYCSAGDETCDLEDGGQKCISGCDTSC